MQRQTVAPAAAAGHTRALLLHAAMTPSAQTSRPTAGTAAIQAKLSVDYSKSLDAYQINGRPDFTTELKKQVFDEADQDGESYIVKFSDNSGVSFQFPSVHRRHKLAWSLWRAAVNTVLAKGDEDELESLMERCYVPGKWQTWNEDEFEDARDDGKYLEAMAKDFFNDPDNLWLGPGDENMGKGGGLDKAIAAYVKNPTVKRRQKVKESAFDPHNKTNFEYREPSSTSGGGWYYYDVPQSPRSDEMEKTTDHILKSVLKRK